MHVIQQHVVSVSNIVVLRIYRIQNKLETRVTLFNDIKYHFYFHRTDKCTT